MALARWVLALIGVSLLASPAMPAGFAIQELVKASDVFPDKPFANFEISGLNDHGEVVFYAPLDEGGIKMGLYDFAGGKLAQVLAAGDRAGDVQVLNLVPGGIGPTNGGQTLIQAIDSNSNDLLFQYAGGQLSLILGPGQPAPGGVWATPPNLLPSPSMNADGNVAFMASVTAGGSTKRGVYLWDAARKRVVPVVTDGDGRTDKTVLAALAPAINNHGEIVAAGFINGQAGIQLRDATGNFRLIAPTLQTLPDGRKLGQATSVLVNDVDDVAFVSYDIPTQKSALYLVAGAGGPIAGPIVAEGQPAPGGGIFSTIDSVQFYPGTSALMVVGRVNGDQEPFGLYQWSDGKLTALLVPKLAEGQTARPAGPNQGRRRFTCVATIQNARRGLRLVRWWFDFQLHPPAELAASLDEDTVANPLGAPNGAPVPHKAIYTVGSMGQLTAVLRNGDSTSLGTVVDVGAPRPYAGQDMGLNGRGQIALIAVLQNGNQEHESILLLTPQ